jgi:hypothetical protein
MSNIKLNILEAIETLIFDCYDFEHHFDICQRSYAKAMKEYCDENFLIQLEIEEEVRWERDGQNYDVVSYTVSDFKVIDPDGKDIETNIKDSEILKSLRL